MSAPLKVHSYFRGRAGDLPPWTCYACLEPFPCTARKAQLREQYATNRAGLVDYMAEHYAAAVLDLPGVDRGELFERFTGWTLATP